MTREATARETPARSATSSSVGNGRGVSIGIATYCPLRQPGPSVPGTVYGGARPAVPARPAGWGRACGRRVFRPAARRGHRQATEQAVPFRLNDEGRLNEPL